MSKVTRATMALDRAGVTYSIHAYGYGPDADRIGVQAAENLGVAPVTMLKTLMSSGQLNNAALGVTTGSAHLERKENANAR
jgi:prolyl-tRNA editing enzyme YbaK/EbsC (Cys-tRNA(Pro) deacylase)